MTLKVKKIAGNFYQAYDTNGPVFIGTKEKATAYASGNHDPKVQTLFEEAAEPVHEGAVGME